VIGAAAVLCLLASGLAALGAFRATLPSQPEVDLR
jgi:hypothetical protein